MEIDNLIEEYRNLPKICAKIDYADKKSVKANNKAVSRMYKIVDLLNQDSIGFARFKELLDINEYKTNLWVATHILEKMNPEKDTERKALNIIQDAAAGNDILALGYQTWLKNYKKNK